MSKAGKIRTIAVFGTVGAKGKRGTGGQARSYPKRRDDRALSAAIGHPSRNDWQERPEFVTVHPKGVWYREIPAGLETAPTELDAISLLDDEVVEERLHSQ